MRRIPMMFLGALALAFKRRRRVAGLSGDAVVRRDEMLSLTAGVARSIGWARIKARIAGKRRGREIRRAAVERATQQAVEQLGAMKGLSMKLGQMMSYLNVLDEDQEASMAALQTSVPPMEFDLVRAVVEEQLGDVPERIFASFDPTPIAAASVGQVHRARLHDDREVVVKVQYPGVAETFAADLANMERLTEMSALAMNADITDYVGMLSESVVNELDYGLEQRNQQRLADLYRDHPFVLIPDTIPELCRPRVLVSEFVAGDRFQTAVANRSKDDRDRIGEIMYRFAFGCVMNGFFSGDPHPGNYLFPDDRVCFLDFGMVMDVAQPGRDSLVAQIIGGSLQGRQEIVDDGLRELGFLPEGGPSGAEMWEEIRHIIAGPIDIDAVTRLDRFRFREGMQKLMDPRSHTNQAFLKTNHFEGWAAICMRYTVGSLAAISKFEPEANWRQVIGEIVLGHEPTTAIGEAWGSSPGGSAFIGSRFTR
ncbi:MAG TPA: AarF/ABC1/UbiB kinase family protein [Acidimicrobiales bacterium]|nr:AarF/ABC1/UbiB kinase family protein [Acidimicrobiales bacterium]